MCETEAFDLGPNLALLAPFSISPGHSEVQPAIFSLGLDPLFVFTTVPISILAKSRTSLDMTNIMEKHTIER